MPRKTPVKLDPKLVAATLARAIEYAEYGDPLEATRRELPAARALVAQGKLVDVGDNCFEITEEAL